LVHERSFPRAQAGAFERKSTDPPIKRLISGRQFRKPVGNQDLRIPRSSPLFHWSRGRGGCGLWILLCVFCAFVVHSSRGIQGRHHVRVPCPRVAAATVGMRRTRNAWPRRRGHGTPMLARVGTPACPDPAVGRTAGLLRVTWWRPSVAAGAVLLDRPHILSPSNVRIFCTPLSRVGHRSLPLHGLRSAKFFRLDGSFRSSGRGWRGWEL